VNGKTLLSGDSGAGEGVGAGKRRLRMGVQFVSPLSMSSGSQYLADGSANAVKAGSATIKMLAAIKNATAAIHRLRINILG
jgi:hypothetical protein